RAMSRSTRPSRPISGRISRASWRSGARTIRSSCRLVPRPSSATFRMRSSASSTPAISRCKRMPRRSPRQCATFSPAESLNRRLMRRHLQGGAVMRAIVLEKFGGLDSLVYTDLPEPEPLAGHVVIEIKAFGLNHAEMHMRRGEWAEAAKVIGIECVGLVKSCPGGEFPVGAKVAALMGGLGRTINGSYAE